MDIDSDIHQWLSIWEQRGRPEPEGLGIDSPELLERVRRHIEQLIRADKLLAGPDALATADDLPPSPSPAGPRPRGSRPSHAPERIGPYKVLEKVGEGGWGVVYVAEQQQPVRRRVAVKVIKLGMDTEQVIARFEAERQALAMMDHPNIAKVLDAGTTDSGRPYFVMELVRGMPITGYCDQNKVSTRQRIELFVQVCRAVQHAHQKGIIHRDLKPSNILVTMHDGVPLPKVIDFGIAKATDQRLTDKTVYTQLHQFIGTPAYMSPEQAEMSGLDIDTRSDIYSLGVLLYELLTGLLPFDADELAKAGIEAMRKSLRDREPPRPSTRLAKLKQEELTTAAQRRASAAPKLIHLLKGDLDWVVMKCLEKDRTRRYETVSGLAADLLRHLGDEPVSARPPSTTYRLRKSLRRNSVAWATGAAISLTVVAAAVVSSWQAVKARRAEAAATVDRDIAKRAAGEAETQRGRAEAQVKATAAERDRADAAKTAAEGRAYAAKMLLVRLDWDNSKLQRLADSLAETATYAERGFEWYFWNRLCHLELFSLRFYDGVPTGAFYSPNGKKIACGNGRDLHVVDAGTGRELLSWRAHADDIWSAGWSPDSLRIVSGGKDKLIRIWDAESGKQVQKLHGHVGPITGCCFSPDGKLVGSASTDGTARVWSASSGEQVFCAQQDEGHCWAVAFSPDSQFVATGGADKVARIFDLRNGREIKRLSGHTNGILACLFTPDGQHLVSSSMDYTAKVWDLQREEELLTYRGHSDQIWVLGLAPDGRSILTGSRDGAVKAWDLRTGKDLTNIRGATVSVWSVCFSPDGRRLVTGASDRSVKVFDFEKQPDCRVLAHADEQSCVTFANDNRTIATAGKDGHICLWDVTDGRLLQTINAHEGWITSVRFSPDGKMLASAGADGKMKWWDVATGREKLSVKAHGDQVWSVMFSPDGQRVISGGHDRSVRVWDVATGRELNKLDGHTGEVYAVAYSPDGRLIASAGQDRTVRLFDAVSGAPMRCYTAPDTCWDVAFSPAGSTIAAASNQVATVWDLSSGLETLRLAEANVQALGPARNVLAFASGGRRLFMASASHATLWNCDGSGEMLALHGHSGNIGSLAMSPDEMHVATASADKTVRVYTIASAAQSEGWEQDAQRDAARWSDEQAKRAASLNDQLKSLAQDPGTITSWLVLAPIPINLTDDLIHAIRAEHVSHEDTLHPSDGSKVDVKGQGLIWRSARTDGLVLDFGQVLGRSPTHSVGYAVCYVSSAQRREDLLMKVGKDDNARVWINGHLMYETWPRGRGFRFDEDTVAGVELRAGMNTVVFKIANGAGDWKGSLRFTDNEGRPVKGLQVTLDPNGTTFAP